MDLTERKIKILTAVTEQYIANGDPVGSKSISDSLSVSSATVRNEMAQLVLLGLLEQPHTSAGRIPSSEGFRYYIENIMSHSELGNTEKMRLAGYLDPTLAEPEKILSRAGEILSQETSLAAVMTTPSDENAVIRNVELVPLGRTTSMLVMTLSTGVARSRIFSLPSDMELGDAQLFYNIADAYFIGRPVGELTAAKIQSIAISLGERTVAMLPIMAALKELVLECGRSDVIVSGLQNLVKASELDPYRTIAFLRNKDAVKSVLDRTRQPITVLVGVKDKNRQLDNLSMIIAQYGSSAGGRGAIALAGPVRMDYPRFVPVVKYMSELVSDSIERVALSLRR